MSILFFVFNYTTSGLSGAEGQLDKNSSMQKNNTLSERTARTDRFKAQKKPVRRPGKTFYNKPPEHIFYYLSQNPVGCLY